MNCHTASRRPCSCDITLPSEGKAEMLKYMFPGAKELGRSDKSVRKRARSGMTGDILEKVLRGLRPGAPGRGMLRGRGVSLRKGSLPEVGSFREGNPFPARRWRPRAARGPTGLGPWAAAEGSVPCTPRAGHPRAPERRPGGGCGRGPGDPGDGAGDSRPGASAPTPVAAPRRSPARVAGQRD